MARSSRSSTASSVDFYVSNGEQDVHQALHLNALPAMKRKADDGSSSPGKRVKLDSPSHSTSCALKPCAGLPPAVWQHVFLSCSLFDLGRLVQVNRSFHSYLTDVRTVSPPDHLSNSLPLLKSESVWASARNALPVKPPKPLPGFSEWQMWRLVWSRRCQFCGKLGSSEPGEKIWQKGPSTDGVRAIWPFGVKSCGPCLMEKCQTDASLLFSNASALRPALPYVFITNDKNYIPAYTLQAATTPADVQIAKYFFRQYVEDITKELKDVLSLGDGAAEEWSKGLEARGIERMNMAEKWERWEAQYQWWSDHHDQPKQGTPAALSSARTAQALQKEPSRSPSRQAVSPVIHAPVPATVASAPQYMHPRPPTVPQQYTPHPIPTGSVPPRGERNLHDANEVKATRKADIERRCQQMDPPIPPNILRHMDSFKAAIQISQPMSDYAWSVLQPRLVAQLPAAQQAEVEHVSRLTSLSRATDRRHLEVNSKEAKEVMDREWEESQRPIRDKLSAIADDFINQDWDHGRAVTSENSPKFAVDLLVYVRGTFYTEFSKDARVSAPEQAPDVADGSTLKGPRLVLENMKWVYDNKIKPLTEPFRKELFLCYGTGCEGNPRFYGFEGVIQHFGAKHTNAFSVGNVVVAWREAEWPEETPFHPDPISVKHAYHLASSAGGHTGYGAYHGGYSRAGTSTPHVQSHLPQASPGPYQFGGQPNGPFAPPQMTPAAIPGYDYGQAFSAPTDSYSYSLMAPPGYGPPMGNGYMTSPAMSNPAIAPPPQGLPLHGSNNAAHHPEELEYRTPMFDKQVSTIIEMAQALWKSTSGIKDLPNSLRIYVMLQRIVSKFHVEFNHEPNLNHFIDAFSNHEIPRALKNAPGLSCKACQDDISHHPSRPEERRTYTACNLLSHFKAQHCGHPAPAIGSGQPPGALDWKEDMIELPGDRFISGLIHAPGMDDEKLLMFATVFPKLFPTPLPRIGTVQENGMASESTPTDSKDAPRTSPPGPIIDKSGPSSQASPYADSPRPSKPLEDEYDPLRPGLAGQANPPGKLESRKHSYRGSPSTDRRSRFYAERYYLPREQVNDDYRRPRDYLEYAPSPRRVRDPGPVYEEYHDPRQYYREREGFYPPNHGEAVHAQDYDPYSRQIRYVEADEGQPEYRYVRHPPSGDRTPLTGQAAADRFLADFVPGQPHADATGDAATAPQTDTNVAPPEPEGDDSARYTPPPPIIPAADGINDHQGRSLAPAPRTAPSTISNGSRYEDSRSAPRQVPTPESGRGGRRPGPHRRRDRYHDHVPARYYRYMSVARDEPYSRGASMGRSQSKRYERYEEQRRRIDQQETPQPIVEREYNMHYSRDHSVDQGPPDDTPFQLRQAPREYVSIQDRLHAFSPPRYRYAGYPEDPRPPPIYVDEYGHPIREYGQPMPIREYDIIRVPRDSRPPRGPYVPHPPPSRFIDHEPERVQYVPVSYDRPLPERYNGRPNYYYYEERERQPPERRPTYEPEGSYEAPPPEIKAESIAPAPDVD